MAPIRICSYNCNGLKASMGRLRLFCEQFDIIFLQELLLRPCDLGILQEVHQDFLAIGTSPMDDSAGIIRGRPKGGVGVLWRNTLSAVISPLAFPDCSFCNGISIKSSLGNIDVIGVYLPVDHGTAQDLATYDLALYELGAIVDDLTSESLICLGDWNADLLKNGSRFSDFASFCKGMNLSILDEDLSGSNFTFVSPAHDSVSWLDHIAVSESLLDHVSSMRILYNVSASDHMPIGVDLEVNLTLAATRPMVKEYSVRIDWNGLDLAGKTLYQEELTTLLCDIPDICCPCDATCGDGKHKTELDLWYTQLISALREASCLVGSPRSNQSKAGRLVPGWNNYLKDLHARSMSAFYEWKQVGRPLNGPHRDKMRQQRSAFRRELQRCRKEVKNLRAERLAETNRNRSPAEFWREVKRLKPKGTTCSAIDGITCPEEVTKRWQIHFACLFGADNEPADFSEFELGSSTPVEQKWLFDTASVKTAVRKLNSGSAADGDQISAGHFRNAPKLLFDKLSNFFNQCLTHCYLPGQMLDSIMVPVPKGRNLDLGKLESYRGIALVSTISKILELCIETTLCRFLLTSDAQCGFKVGHSTLTATHLVKEVVKFYRSRGSGVFACFVDVKKAFDSVNHRSLLFELRNRGVPDIFVALFACWLANQNIRVKWNNLLSLPFPVRRGVRQGGCLSPTLFNIYLDPLVRGVRELYLGCRMAGCAFNIIAYADDIVLLSPTRCGLQKLLDFCAGEARQLNLEFSETKSKAMSFPCRRLDPHENITPLRLADCNLEWVHSFNYLGITLTSDGGCEGDMDRARRAFFKSFNSFLHTFARCSFRVKTQLFQAYCYHLYGCELWGGGRRGAWGCLGVGVNSAMKLVLGLSKFESSRFAAVIGGFLPLEEWCWFRRLLLAQRLLSCPNSLVEAIRISQFGMDGQFWPDVWQLYRDLGLSCVDLSSLKSSDIWNFLFGRMARSFISDYYC